MHDSNFPISIAHVTAPQTPESGDFVYRVGQPGAAMGALPGVQTISFTMVSTARERLFRDADVLVIEMVGDVDLLPVLLDRRKRRKLTVFEVSDNFLEFQASNPSSVFYEDPFNRAALMQLLSLSHAMQTTMPELEKRFARFNPRCAVFMNQMKSLGNPARGDGPITVGWGGSLGHLEDIRRTAPALIAWLERNPAVRLAIMADEKIAGLFDSVPRDRIQITPPGSLDDYYKFLENLHIGLAPLRDEEFNLCRSDVKFMEYASRGVVPVCSDVPTYSRTLRHGETGFLFKDVDGPDGMIDILDKLVANPQLMSDVARAAFDYIRTERSAAADANERIAFYRNLVSELELATSGPLAWAAKIPGARRSPDSNHLLLEFGPVEQLLHDGLAAQFRNHNLTAALGMFKNAAKVAPDFYPARFLYSNALLRVSARRAEEELEASIAADSGKCAAPLQLAQLRADRGDTSGALSIIKNLEERLPDFAPAFAAEARIHRSAGDVNLALEFFMRALDANRWFTPAATFAALLLLELNRPKEAREMFARALEFAPRLPANRLGMSATLQLLGDFAASAEQLAAALELAPTDANTANLLLDTARQLFKKGDLNATAKALRKIVEFQSENFDALFWLARTLERLGEHDNALEVWQKLTAPDAPENYRKIADNKIDN